MHSLHRACDTASMDVTPFLALLLIALLSLVFFFSAGRKTSSPPKGDGRRLPPSPRGYPLLGHLPLLGSLPHRKLREMAATHGPVMLLRLGRVPTVVASSAAAAEEAMKTRDLAFASRPRTLMAERLLYGCDVGFAPYGEYWRQVRRVCVVHLLSPRRIASFRRAREHEVAALVARVRHAVAAAGGEVNLSDLLICYSKAVISRAALGDGNYGLAGDEGGEKLRRVLADFMELLVAAPVREMAPWLGWVDTLTGLEAKTKRTFEALDVLLERVIADHRSRRPAGDRPVVGGGADDHRDFVDVLLDVNEMDKDAELRLDTDNIKAIILDMFAAGADTSSTVLGWAMAELMNHPHEMHKLQDKVRAAAAGATGGGHLTEDYLDDMPYLKAVISETLRLHAPVPLLLPRETTEDTELLGYHIPAHTRVVINAWAISRDPATWEHAEEFMPQRFVDAQMGDYGKVGQNFKFVPFGAGRRGCPGAGFAAPVVELALANMLYHFDWELACHGRELGTRLVDVSEEYGVSVRLKVPLVLVAKPRFHP